MPRCAIRQKTYLALGLLEGDVQFGHGIVYQTERLDDIVEDDRLPLQLFILAESSGVDEFHLLQDGRLSRLSGSCKQSIGQLASWRSTDLGPVRSGKGWKGCEDGRGGRGTECSHTEQK